jgi:hypothetical protein
MATNLVCRDGVAPALIFIPRTVYGVIAPGHIICYLITCWLVTVGQVSGAVETPLDSECPAVMGVDSTVLLWRPTWYVGMALHQH